MNRPRKQKEYKPKPALTGEIQCEYKHRWLVIDINPERDLTECPICGVKVKISRLERK